MTSLNFVGVQCLPSQHGHKGRPRKHGRVQVSLTFAQGREAVMGFLADKNPKESRSGDSAAYRRVVAKMIPALCERLGVKPTDITLYRRESTLMGVRFIVKGIDRDALVVFDQPREG